MPTYFGGQGGAAVDEGRYLDKDRVAVLYFVKEVAEEYKYFAIN
jgi:hypothetical protein